METNTFFEALAPWVAADARQPLDPCPDVRGMASAKKLKLLNLAASFLPGGQTECYLEVGTYQGKSTIAALLGNPDVVGVACDNFTLFNDPAQLSNADIFTRNLNSHGLAGQIRFFNCDFRALFENWGREALPPAGVYFYDGAHDEVSQFEGLHLAEPLLADKAVVIVDDWRLAPDSGSYAEAGTRRAMAASAHRWVLRHVLPARFNGDLEQWWNGVAVLEFNRYYPE